MEMEGARTLRMGVEMGLGRGMKGGMGRWFSWAWECGGRECRRRESGVDLGEGREGRGGLGGIRNCSGLYEVVGFFVRVNLLIAIGNGVV